MKIRYCPSCKINRRVKFISHYSNMMTGLIRYECSKCFQLFDLVTQGVILPTKKASDPIRYSFEEVNLENY